MRAYSTSARLAIDKALLSEVREAIVLTYEISYSHLSQIENISKTGGFQDCKNRVTLIKSHWMLVEILIKSNQ